MKTRINTPLSKLIAEDSDNIATAKTISMKRRFLQPETNRDKKNVAPPTAKYWYGTGGRRWAGRGRKAPLSNWKRTDKVRKQYQKGERSIEYA